MVPDHSTKHHNSAEVALPASAPFPVGMDSGIATQAEPVRLPIAFVFGLTIFLSATLLFMVQPLFARMVLPRLGGSPAVWNTALVFFQAALLLGYLYAHGLTTWFRPRQQLFIHLAVLAAPLLLLPLTVPHSWIPPVDRSPVASLLIMMAVSVGIPFFVVSSTSPLLQKWFAMTGHPQRNDPYFLYAASNCGSLLGLLSYPLLLEPALRLNEQSWIWSGGYFLFVVSVFLCGTVIWRQRTGAGVVSEPNLSAVLRPAVAISWERRLRWLLLAFVPSSLMVSVTTYLGTHVAAVPLMWVIPLGVFLLTFILVFARGSVIPHDWVVRAFPMVILPLVVILASRGSDRIWWLGAWHLLALFAVAMVCHGELVRDRPEASRLTEFYLWMSLGGVLGGGFNALVAPLIFTSVAEYPITLTLACLLLPRRKSSGSDAPVNPALTRLLDFALPVVVGLLAFNLMDLLFLVGLQSIPVILALNLCLPPLICFTFVNRPVRFGLAVGMILLASAWLPGERNRVVAAERSFFGIHRVIDDAAGNYRRLHHGGTVHGTQNLDPARRHEPLGYYYPGGPVGQFFRSRSVEGVPHKVAVVGLGAGGLSAYALPGQEWTYYEIDATVERIARDPKCFSFLAGSAAPVNVVLGDARLSLADTTEQYDVLIFDAYSSDCIPVHLMSREAMALYLARLAPGGVLVFHITNRHLDLEPVLAGLVADAGLTGVVWDDSTIAPAEHARGKRVSKWALVARSKADIRTALENPNWKQLRSRDDLRIWTDDYSSVFSVFLWH